MRNHVARSHLVDHQPKTVSVFATSDHPQRSGDPLLVSTERRFVRLANGARVVLALPETAVVASDQNLHLPAFARIGPENVEVRIPGNFVEGRFKLFEVSDRA